MASKYLQKYPVPAGFQQILADFTREVLRDQPSNIIEYASKYFQMLEKGDKFQFNSKYNVNKDDKKYQLSYNPKNAQEITKKATSIATKVNDTGKDQKQQKVAEASNKVGAEAKPEAPKPSAESSNQRNISANVLDEISQIFDEVDVNENGYIETSEIRKAISVLAQRYGVNEQQISQQQIRQFIEELDANNDGKISREQFINFISAILAPLFDTYGGSQKTVNQQEVQGFMGEQSQNALQKQLMDKFEEIFQKFDVDQSGLISSNQVYAVAEKFSAETGEEIGQAELDEYIKVIDTNRDGQISKQELYQFFMSTLAG